VAKLGKHMAEAGLYARPGIRQRPVQVEKDRRNQAQAHATLPNKPPCAPR
jgi:hypothetical protein